MENKLYLFGASGHCKVIVDVLQSKNEIVTAIFDDSPKSGSLFDIPVLNAKNCADVSDSKMIVSVGDNATRKKIVERFNANFHVAVHEKAIISRRTKIGEGSVIMAGVIINADSRIGKHCILNTGAIIEHDCDIADFVHISPNASIAGNVTVGEGTHIGIGAVVIQRVTIGSWATIGAGAVIIDDVPDYAVVVGVPGKIIKFNSKNE